jgi:hypothetical protein
MMSRLTRVTLAHRGAVLVIWCALVCVAGALAVRLEGVLEGGSDGVPGSASVTTIQRAVSAGIPAGSSSLFSSWLSTTGCQFTTPPFSMPSSRWPPHLRKSPEAARYVRTGIPVASISSVETVTRR